MFDKGSQSIVEIQNREIVITCIFLYEKCQPFAFHKYPQFIMGDNTIF